MNERKIPKTLIRKDGSMSLEVEYSLISAMEMQLGAVDYLLENEPRTPEECLEYIKTGMELIEASDYKINPESRLGVILRETIELKFAEIEKKLDELEKKARMDTESNLIKESVQIKARNLIEEYENNRGSDDYEQ